MPEPSRDQILAAVRRYADAWAAGDTATIFDCYADDIVLHWGGAHAFSGSHAGKSQALQALAAFTQRTGRRLTGIIDVMAATRGASSSPARRWGRTRWRWSARLSTASPAESWPSAGCWTATRP